MNSIFQALDSGHSPEKILQFLSKSNPKLAPLINRAIGSGYLAKQILGFLAKSSEPEDTRHLSGPQRQARNRVIEGQLAKRGLAIGLTALSGSDIGMRAAQTLSSAPEIQTPLSGQQNMPQTLASGAIPTTPGRQIQESMQRKQPREPLDHISSQQPPVGQVSPNIAQPQQVTQPEGIINPREYLEKLGIKDKVDDLLKRGNTPEQTAATLGLSGSAKKMGKGKIDPELLANIDAYSKEAKPQEEQKVPDLGGMGKGIVGNLYSGLFDALQKGSTKFAGIEDPLLKRAKPLFDAGKIKSVEDLQKFANEKQPITKSEIVASPNGIGEVVTARNGRAIIDVDGKKHQVEEAKLLKPPKEAAIEALELIKSFTPEQQRSTHHMLNAYDAEEKKGFFVFHNDSAYIVDDISPEEYKELSEEIEEAKTTGETIIGQWAAGEGSRGAGYNKIVKGVRDRKVVPGLKKKYRKLKVGYNLLSEWQKLLGEHAKELRSQGNQTSE